MADRLHVVKEGEWLDSIAHDYGFPSGQDIYHYERNEGLRERRPDPKVIRPGDEIWIPDCPYVVEIDLKATGGKDSYKIEVALPGKEKLILVMHDSAGEPMANEPYLLQIGGYNAEGQTDGDGRIEEEFDSELLRFDHYNLSIAGQVFELALGHLDPVDTVEGIQARLANLGYDPGPVDGITGPRTRRAVRQFQADQSLAIDGIAGPKTRAKLDEVYG